MSQSGDERVGATINDRYKLQRVLGSGATGTVYSATQLAVDRTVAVKLLHDAEDQDFQRRFETEAKAIGRLNHRNCITLHDFGFWEEAGTHFMVTEFIDGELLADRMMDHMPTEFVLHLAAELAQALNHAHTHNILHRDLKPENIMLVKGDQRWESIKVLDFGLAKMLDAIGLRMTPMAGLPVPGTAPEEVVGMGTPIYMSPEQCRGDITITPATDIYSMGVLVFELLEGHVPYDGASRAEVCEKHANSTIPEITNPEVEPHIRQLLGNMLSKDPRERPTAREVLEMLRGPSQEIARTGWENEEFQFEEMSREAPEEEEEEEVVTQVLSSAKLPGFSLPVPKLPGFSLPGSSPGLSLPTPRKLAAPHLPGFSAPAESVSPVEEPQVQQPPVEESPVEESPVDEPQVGKPQVEEPLVEEPQVEEPQLEQPPVEESPVDEPQVEEPLVEEPLVEEPKVEELQVEEPLVEQPKVEEPLVEQPLDDADHAPVFDDTFPQPQPRKSRLPLVLGAAAVVGVAGLVWGLMGDPKTPEPSPVVVSEPATITAKEPESASPEPTEPKPEPTAAPVEPAADPAVTESLEKANDVVDEAWAVGSNAQQTAEPAKKSTEEQNVSSKKPRKKPKLRELKLTL